MISSVTRQTYWTAIALSAGAALAAVLVLPLIGSTDLNYRLALAGVSPHKEILFYFRLPRVLLAMLGGGCLSIAGTLFQALLRDNLAEPYTLGVSSGGSLGAVIAISLGWPAVAGFSPIWISAFCGSALVLLVVMRVASQGGRLSSFTLLLAGVTINSICLALILFLQNLATFGQSFTIVRWLMGGIESIEYSTLAWLSALLLPVCIYLCTLARHWNLLAVGEEWASARGAATGRLMRTGYFAGSFLTGSITAFTGPIAFLGLIVPHALRLKLGADHRILMPCAFFAGGAFLALCDTLARTVLAPTEIPVGVITALLGGPFFIWTLRSRRKSLWI